MKQKKWISVFLGFNFAILAIFGWLLFQTVTILQNRMDTLYVLTQETTADAEIALCDTPAFAPIETIGVDMAHQRAIDFMGFGKRIFSQVDYDDPVYKFHAHVDGGELLVQICQISGQVIRAENPRGIRHSNLTIAEGLEAAKQALLRSGYDNMVFSHFQAGEHTVQSTFSPICGSFAPIEVVIGLDNGRIVGFFTKQSEA